jgi:hypothetical protein
MDKEQVSQDKNKLLNRNFKSIVFALDKDGNYTKVPSIGWEPENLALKQEWDSINERIELAKSNVISGKLSPIAYYMEKYQLRVMRLASLTGFSKRTIRKHLNPKTFAKTDPEILATYAKVFQVTSEQLIQPF